jgi:4,5-DOPA dioxygenase extradiol
MPVLFLGHGSPMNAIEDNEFSRGWIEAAKALPRPKAILCISAHWETRGLGVTAMEKPRTIHDFGGFPPELYAMQYPAPGSAWLAQRVGQVVQSAPVMPDQRWGLDHGAWSVLCRMYPAADIPVVQLSLDRSQGPDFHFQLGRELQALRDEGVLIVGSGNVVHNLRLVVWEGQPYDWAVEFDSHVRQWIVDGENDPLIHYEAPVGAEARDRAAALAINSAEHYLPLLYVLGARLAGEPVSFFNEKIEAGSLSMRCVRVG